MGGVREPGGGGPDRPRPPDRRSDGARRAAPPELPPPATGPTLALSLPASPDDRPARRPPKLDDADGWRAGCEEAAYRSLGALQAVIGQSNIELCLFFLNNIQIRIVTKVDCLIISIFKNCEIWDEPNCQIIEK